MILIANSARIGVPVSATPFMGLAVCLQKQVHSPLQNPPAAPISEASGWGRRKANAKRWPAVSALPKNA